MKYSSVVTEESKLPEFAGVSYTLKKISEGRRIKLRLKLAEQFSRTRELFDQAKDADEGKKADLAMSIRDVIENEISPEFVRMGLDRIDGLEIDDQPATPELLIESGPRDLYHEILARIREEAGLSEAEQKNSQSPIISTAPEDGPKNNISAESASAKATT